MAHNASHERPAGAVPAPKRQRLQREVEKESCPVCMREFVSDEVYNIVLKNFKHFVQQQKGIPAESLEAEEDEKYESGSVFAELWKRFANDIMGANKPETEKYAAIIPVIHDVLGNNFPTATIRDELDLIVQTNSEEGEEEDFLKRGYLVTPTTCSHIIHDKCLYGMSHTAATAGDAEAVPYAPLYDVEEALRNVEFAQVAVPCPMCRTPIRAVITLKEQRDEPPEVVTIDRTPDVDAQEDAYGLYGLRKDSLVWVYGIGLVGGPTVGMVGTLLGNSARNPQTHFSVRSIYPNTSVKDYPKQYVFDIAFLFLKVLPSRESVNQAQWTRTSNYLWTLNIPLNYALEKQFFSSSMFNLFIVSEDPAIVAHFRNSINQVAANYYNSITQRADQARRTLAPLLRAHMGRGARGALSLTLSRAAQRLIGGGWVDASQVSHDIQDHIADILGNVGVSRPLGALDTLNLNPNLNIAALERAAEGKSNATYFKYAYALAQQRFLVTDDKKIQEDLQETMPNGRANFSNFVDMYSGFQPYLTPEEVRSNAQFVLSGGRR